MLFPPPDPFAPSRIRRTRYCFPSGHSHCGIPFYYIRYFGRTYETLSLLSPPLFSRYYSHVRHIPAWWWSVRPHVSPARRSRGFLSRHPIAGRRSRYGRIPTRLAAPMQWMGPGKHRKHDDKLRTEVLPPRSSAASRVHRYPRLS